ncbi:MAG: hypothetical protein QOE90_1076 [Thermoplasmata archaeon]|nr:hypothetical protein [Thermoplasmata archaeon]
MAKRTGVFLKEFVVLFGFLNGVWIAVGVNPGREFLGIVQGLVESATGGNGWVKLLFTWVPVALAIAALVAIFRKGGWLGFVAVLAGFLSGLYVLADPRLSLGLLVVALALGWFAAR